jgi:hypothetical protein
MPLLARRASTVSRTSCRGTRELVVGDGGAEAVTGVEQVDLDGGDDALTALLDRGGAVAEGQIRRGQVGDVAVEVVQEVNVGERVGQLLPVRANVLNGRRAAGPGDAAEPLDTRPPVGDGVGHQPVPRLPRLHPQAHGTLGGVEPLDASGQHADDGAVETLIGDDDVRAAAKQQPLVLPAPHLVRGVDELLLGRRVDHLARRASDAHRGRVFKEQP